MPVERAASQTKTSRIIAITERELSGGRHMPSNDLVASLKEHGIDLGAKPIASLSAYLSKSGRFVSERAKGGWTLKEQSHKEEAPQGVDAPAGPDLLDFSVPAKDTGTVAG